jgi:hypothetical protein
MKIKDILTHGIQFKIRVGEKAFDPSEQKRTTWTEDILKRGKDNADTGRMEKV